MHCSLFNNTLFNSAKVSSCILYKKDILVERSTIFIVNLMSYSWCYFSDHVILWCFITDYATLLEATLGRHITNHATWRIVDLTWWGSGPMKCLLSIGYIMRILIEWANSKCTGELVYLHSLARTFTVLSVYSSGGNFSQRTRSLALLSGSTWKMSCIVTKPTKWHVRPVKTQISLGICPGWSEPACCLHEES